MAGLVVYGILAACAYFSGVKWLAPVLLCWPEALEITWYHCTWSGFVRMIQNDSEWLRWEVKAVTICCAFQGMSACAPSCEVCDGRGCFVYRVLCCPFVLILGCKCVSKSHQRFRNQSVWIILDLSSFQKFCRENMPELWNGNGTQDLARFPYLLLPLLPQLLVVALHASLLQGHVLGWLRGTAWSTSRHRSASGRAFEAKFLWKRWKGILWFQEFPNYSH